jgi:hypothetical protein
MEDLRIALQHIPGNAEAFQTTYAPGPESHAKEYIAPRMAMLLKQAADAHHEYERILGHPDADWPAWYAAYIVGRF